MLTFPSRLDLDFNHITIMNGYPTKRGVLTHRMLQQLTSEPENSESSSLSFPTSGEYEYLCDRIIGPGDREPTPKIQPISVYLGYPNLV